MRSTGAGQPDHPVWKVLPVYRRSCTPSFEDQKPDAVRSRTRLKNATPCECSGFAFFDPGAFLAAFAAHKNEVTAGYMAARPL